MRCFGDVVGLKSPANVRWGDVRVERDLAVRRKGAQQRGIPVGAKPLGNGGIGSETVEAVKGTGIDMQLGWNTGRDQAPRIVDVLAEKEVEFAHGDISALPGSSPRYARQASRLEFRDQMNVSGRIELAGNVLRSSTMG